MSKIKNKWNQRYLLKGDLAESSMPKAPYFLKDNWQYLKEGRVLDLASGDGAVSLFLSAHKVFELNAVDISDVGLKRLSDLCALQGTNVDCYVSDLEDETIDLSALGVFDAVVISRYKPTDRFWPHLIALLKPGGILLLTTFNREHHQRTGFSQRFCLQPNEYVERFDTLNLLKYESDLNACGEDGYIFERKVD
jgi:tellurite methyltransferase